MYCNCGCGELTHVPEYDHPTRGWKKGVPIKYKKGHHRRGETTTPYPIQNNHRQCSQCRKNKPISKFYKDARTLSGYRSICKLCKDQQRSKYIQARATIVDEIKHNTGCYFCSRNEPCGLDFHHLDPSTKKYDIARMVQNLAPIEDILEEIAKCVVLCAYCHRLLHHKKVSL